MQGTSLNGEREFSPVGVVGLGVVGGAVAAGYREAGVRVVGYDPALGIGSLEELAACRVVFCCVPTPTTEEGAYDVSILWGSLEQLQEVLSGGTLVVVKSTVPP